MKKSYKDEMHCFENAAIFPFGDWLVKQLLSQNIGIHNDDATGKFATMFVFMYIGSRLCQ